MAFTEAQYIIAYEGGINRIKSLVGNEVGDCLCPLILEASIITSLSCTDIMARIECAAKLDTDFNEVKTVDDLYNALNITAIEQVAHQWDLFKVETIKQSRMVRFLQAILEFIDNLINKARAFVSR